MHSHAHLRSEARRRRARLARDRRDRRRPRSPGCHRRNLLRGKHKPIFAPNADTGDYVIVVNADKVALSGNKRADKLVYRHSGFPGGLTATPIGEVLDKDARKAVEKAVWGMLPKNRLGRQMIKKLKVYSGPAHPHQAQKAVPYEISQISQ